MSNNQIKLLFQLAVDGSAYCKVINKPNSQLVTFGMNQIISALDTLQSTNMYIAAADPVQGSVVGIRLGIGNVDYLVRRIIDVSAVENTPYTTEYNAYHIMVTINSEVHGPVFTNSKTAIKHIFNLAKSDVNVPPPDYIAKGKKSSKHKFSCHRCQAGAEKESQLSKTETSTGETILLCELCVPKYVCDRCGFHEPRYLCKTLIEISEITGQNIKSRVCGKCGDGYQRCHHGCGSYFDVKAYNHECPCQIGHNFKNYIKEHNADVLSYYEADKYADEMFGIEIEAGTLNKNRAKFNAIAGETIELVGNNAILKYDSSIDWVNKQEQVDNDYKGFEVVTRPMVYKNALRFLREFCKNRHPLLRSWEVGTCGLHIHVSKACLSSFEIGKILLFINNKGNRKFIKMIAKREDKRFAKFLTKKIMDYKNMSPDCHYEAINTSKKHTIEFRIFRGTLNSKTVVSYLQFVKSVIEFVRVTSLEDLNPGKYTEFLFSTERSSYRELKDRIRLENTKEIDGRDEI